MREKLDLVERKAYMRQKRLNARNNQLSGPIKAIMFSPQTKNALYSTQVKSPTQMASMRTLPTSHKSRQNQTVKLNMAQIYNPYQHPPPRKRRFRKRGKKE
jgi:hypothetical protein